MEDVKMIWLIVLATAATIAVISFVRRQPTNIVGSEMSAEFQAHLRYQLMKDGVRQTITGRTDGSE